MSRAYLINAYEVCSHIRKKYILSWERQTSRTPMTRSAAILYLRHPEPGSILCLPELHLEACLLESYLEPCLLMPLRLPRFVHNRSILQIFFIFIYILFWQRLVKLHIQYEMPHPAVHPHANPRLCPASPRIAVTNIGWNGWHSRLVLGELVVVPVERAVTAGEYWGSKWLCLAKLLTQAASSGKVVSYACWKRYYSRRVLGVKISMSSEIAATGGEFWESG